LATHKERLLASQVDNDNASAPRSTRGRTASKFSSFEGRQYAAPQRLEGPSRLLARLEAFLPELKRANEALDPAQASIENQVNEDEDSSSEDESVQGHRDHRDDLEQHYIEMVRIKVPNFALLFKGISPAILMFCFGGCRIFFLFYFIPPSILHSFL